MKNENYETASPRDPIADVMAASLVPSTAASSSSSSAVSTSTSTAATASTSSGNLRSRGDCLFVVVAQDPLNTTCFLAIRCVAVSRCAHVAQGAADGRLDEQRQQRQDTDVARKTDCFDCSCHLVLLRLTPRSVSSDRTNRSASTITIITRIAPTPARCPRRSCRSRRRRPVRYIQC